jgi:hypothetical protein
MKHLTISFELLEQFDNYTDTEITLEFADLIHGIISDTHMKMMEQTASNSSDNTKKHMIEYYKKNIELIKSIRAYNMIDTNKLAAIITETVYDVKKEATTIHDVQETIDSYLDLL